MLRMPSASPLAAHSAAPRRWLSIVGIGEDGVDGLSPVARGLIADAEIVFGGKRHLELAAALIRGAVRPWPRPFDPAVSEVTEQRGRTVCVLASGDPFFYGIGSVLARHVDPDETVVVPAPSSFSLAAARLGWALHETTLLSLHGRPLDLIRPHLQPGRAHSHADAGWRRAANAGRAAGGERIWRLAPHGAGGAGRPAGAHPGGACRRLFLGRCRSVERCSAGGRSAVRGTRSGSHAGAGGFSVRARRPDHQA